MPAPKKKDLLPDRLKSDYLLNAEKEAQALESAKRIDAIVAKIHAGEPVAIKPKVEDKPKPAPKIIETPKVIERKHPVTESEVDEYIAYLGDMLA